MENAKALGTVGTKIFQLRLMHGAVALETGSRSKGV
jgi:hypothetical protein